MRRARILVLSALACMLVAGPVSAAKPMMERIPINDIGILDEFLTDECGYDIWFDATGHATFHTWTDADDNPLREVNNFNVHLRYYSEGGSITTRDVGADRLTHQARTRPVRRRSVRVLVDPPAATRNCSRCGTLAGR